MVNPETTPDYGPVIEDLQLVADDIYPGGVSIEQGEETALINSENKIILSKEDLKKGVEELAYDIRRKSHMLLMADRSPYEGGNRKPLTEVEVTHLLSRDGILVDRLTTIEGINEELAKRFGPNNRYAHARKEGDGTVAQDSRLLVDPIDMRGLPGVMNIGRAILALRF